MRVAHSSWPFTVLKNKWEIAKNISELSRPTFIVSKKTGHIVVDVDVDATSEKLIAEERKIAQHIVELHNRSLEK